MSLEKDLHQRVLKSGTGSSGEWSQHRECLDTALRYMVGSFGCPMQGQELGLMLMDLS